MNIFRNMDGEQSNDITKLPAYASLPEDIRKEVNNRYETVYNNNQRMGVRIAQGIAFEAAKQLIEAVNKPKNCAFCGDPLKGMGKKTGGGDHICHSCDDHYAPGGPGENEGNYYDSKGKKLKESELDEKHIGWDAMVKHLKGQGHSDKSAEKIAGYINAKKNHLGSFKEEGGTPKGATYENAQDFQDKNDAMVGMTEHDCDHCKGAGCENCGGKNFGVSQQAHVPQAHPQDLDSDLITHASAIMYNPANAFGNAQGDPQDKGPKSIQKMNHVAKGMHDTASQNEQVDPLIAAAAGYMTHRAEVSGIMESVEEEGEFLTEAAKKTFDSVAKKFGYKKGPSGTYNHRTSEAHFNVNPTSGTFVHKWNEDPASSQVRGKGPEELHSRLAQFHMHDIGESEVNEAKNHTFDDIEHGDSVKYKTNESVTIASEYAKLMNEVVSKYSHKDFDSHIRKAGFEYKGQKSGLQHPGSGQRVDYTYQHPKTKHTVHLFTDKAGNNAEAAHSEGGVTNSPKKFSDIMAAHQKVVATHIIKNRKLLKRLSLTTSKKECPNNNNNNGLYGGTKEQSR